MIKTGGDKRDADLFSKRIIIPQSHDHIGVLACLAQQVVLDNIHFIHGKLMFTFSGIDIDKDPFSAADIIIIKQR